MAVFMLFIHVWNGQVELWDCPAVIHEINQLFFLQKLEKLQTKLSFPVRVITQYNILLNIVIFVFVFISSYSYLNTYVLLYYAHYKRRPFHDCPAVSDEVFELILSNNQSE